MEQINSVFYDTGFEPQLVRAVIGTKTKEGNRDCRYGEKIVSFLKPDYFSSKYLKWVVSTIVKHYEKYNTIPTYSEIKGWIASEEQFKDIDKQAIIDLLKSISKQPIDKNQKFVEDSAFNFFVQQEIMNFTKQKSENIRKKGVGDFDSFMYELNQLYKKFHGVQRPVSIDENSIDILNEKEGEFVSLGWGDDFDNQLNFRQGSLLLGIAPTGVGKTTATIVTAVHNFLLGKKVCVVFFEDDYVDLVKKVYAKLSGIPINDVKNNIDYVNTVAKEKFRKAKERGGDLTFIKKSALSTSTNDLENVIQGYISEHGKMDLLILDYIDCLKSSSGKVYKNDFDEQGDVIMEVMDIGSDLNYFIPILTFTQGNRSSINKAFFTGEDVGGSLSKLKKAPQVITIAKTIDDKTDGTATIVIEKNRKGAAGIKFSGVDYDNSRLIINISRDHAESTSKK